MKNKTKQLTKKILYIFLSTIFFVCVAGFIYFYASFNYYLHQDAQMKADPSELKYFQNSYDECRKEFISSANEIKNRFNKVEILTFKSKVRLIPI